MLADVAPSFATLSSTSNGLSDTDETALAVVKYGAPSSCTVATIVTPVGNLRHASRKSSGEALKKTQSR